MNDELSLVLFDMDGVLIRSEKAWFRLMEECGLVFRGARIRWEEFLPTFGQSTERDVASFGLSCSPAELDRYYAENFLRFVGEVEVDADAPRVLEALRGRGISLAVVTNTASALATKILERTGLFERFDLVASADQVPRPKPAPDLPRYALAALGVAPSAACFVGDSVFDRQAARAAGVRFIGLGTEGDATIERLGLLEGALNPPRD